MVTMLVANIREILKNNTLRNIAVLTKRIRSLHLRSILRKKAPIITSIKSLSTTTIPTYSIEKSIETCKAYLKK